MACTEHTLALIDGTNITASAIVEMVNLLTEIKWIKKAGEEVNRQMMVVIFPRIYAQEFISSATS